MVLRLEIDRELDPVVRDGQIASSTSRCVVSDWLLEYRNTDAVCAQRSNV